MGKNVRRAAAAALTAGALMASTPEIAATAEAKASPEVCRKANHNKANRLAGKFVRQLGNRILGLGSVSSTNGFSSIEVAESITSHGVSTRTVTIDTGRSEVPGSNGEYTMEVSSNDVGSNGRLDASDINRVKVAEGSAGDGRPLFAATLYHRQKRWTDGPRDGNCWYNANGTAVDESGQRSVFNGTTDTRYIPQPGLFLNRSEVEATGQVMNGIIDDAQSLAPTHSVQPIFYKVLR